MKTSKRLLEALKATVQDLRSESVYYDWTDVQNCTCGILAQNLLDVSPEDIVLDVGRSESWTAIYSNWLLGDYACSSIPGELRNAGLYAKDIKRLEYAGLPDDLYHRRFYADRYYVADWLENKIVKTMQKRIDKNG